MALSVVTLIFNIILVWQHYVFYLGNEYNESDEEKPLLKSSKKEKFYSVNVDTEGRDLVLATLSEERSQEEQQRRNDLAANRDGSQV